MFQIDDADFKRLVTFIHQNYGISLEKKRHLIQSRLNSVMTTGKFDTFKDYVDYITSGRAKAEDTRIMLNKLTTNHTYFMRENSHFDLFTNKILPELKQKYAKKKSLAIWSAGCSSGQEPYTLSMLLFEFFGSERKSWDLRLLATDISFHVMSKAKQATYTDEEIKDVPAQWRDKYMTKSGSDFTFVPEIRKNVIFREFNLMDPIKFRQPFDVIFCRNVMIYFDSPTKAALVKRFYGASNEGAYLLIGQSETLSKNDNPYSYVGPAVYKK